MTFTAVELLPGYRVRAIGHTTQVDGVTPNRPIEASPGLAAWAAVPVTTTAMAVTAVTTPTSTVSIHAQKIPP